VVERIKGTASVEIKHDGKWKPLDVALVGHREGDVDVSVLAPKQSFGSGHSLTFSDTGDHILSEAVYFFGFPFGLSTPVGKNNQDFPVPFVKKAIIASWNKSRIYLDGHNNSGFSGGPVVLERDVTKVIGIVSSYLSETCSVVDRKGNEVRLDLNTGIVEVIISKAIKDLMESNPIGLPISDS